MNMRRLCECCFAETKENPCPVCGYDRTQASGDTSVLPVNTRLDGRFIIGGVIGKGGFGITYCTYDINNGKRTAIKEYFPSITAGRAKDGKTVIPVDATLYESGMERFFSEAQAVAQFNGNSGIVSVFDCFHENGTAYFSMEYLEGATLEEYINSRGALSCGQAVYLANRISVALMMIHSAGLLHRDISPDNIIICKDGKIKLIDFGAARKLSAESSPKHTVLAKTGFTAAEQYSIRGNYGAWTDIYSLGAVMYYALTGKAPLSPYERMVYDGEFSENCEKIENIKLREIVCKAAGISESERFKSAEELKNALGALNIAEEEFSAEGIDAMRINASLSGRRPSKRRGGILAAASAAAASFVMGAAIFGSASAVLPNAADTLASETSVPESAKSTTAAETTAKTQTPAMTEAPDAAEAPEEKQPVTLKFHDSYKGNMVFNGVIPYEQLESFGGDVAVKLSLVEKPGRQDHEHVGFIVADSTGKNMIQYLSSDYAASVEENGFISVISGLSYEFVITREGIEALGGDLGFETSAACVSSIELKPGKIKTAFNIMKTSSDELPFEALEQADKNAYVFSYDGLIPNGFERYEKVIPRSAFKEFDCDVKMTVVYEQTDPESDQNARFMPINQGEPYNAFGRNITLCEQIDEDGRLIAEAFPREVLDDFWVQAYPPEGEVSFIIRKNYVDRMSAGMNFIIQNALIKSVRLESWEEDTA